MPFPAAANQDRELNVQQLDSARLSGSHEWDIYSQSDISFRHVVEENPQPKSDAARYRMIADVSLEGARSSFARLCSSTTLFRVPSTIKCDRTFALDAYDAYYLDEMHDYLSQPFEELGVEDIPLLKMKLHSRYFCGFSKRCVHFNDLFERRRIDHWVTSESPDLKYFTDLQKATWFPKLEAWIRHISQPCALPIPTPPSFFYYHTELREAQRFPFVADSERIRRLRFCAEKEYYIYFLMVWWNELIRGGKAFIIRRDTIDILNEHCGNIPDIAGKPAQAIIERMRMFADMPQYHHNWLCFPDREFEASPFIFAVKGVGTHDSNISSGRRLWCRRDHRKVTVSRYSSTTYKRLTLLEERISGPELDEVPGLLSLVRDQDWSRYNSLRVQDLLQNLVSLYSKTRSQLDESERRFEDEARWHEQTRKDLDIVESDLNYTRDRLDDVTHQLEAANSTKDMISRQLDDARCEIQYINQNRHDSRQLSPRGGQNAIIRNDSFRSPSFSPNMEQTSRERTPAMVANYTGNPAARSEVNRTQAPNASHIPRTLHTLGRPALRSAVSKALVQAIERPSSPFISRIGVAKTSNSANMRQSSPFAAPSGSRRNATPDSPRIPRKRIPKDTPDSPPIPRKRMPDCMR